MLFRSCGADQSCLRERRIAVADAFFFEAEFHETGGYVQRLHKVAFGSSTGYDEYSSARARIVGGPALEQSKTDLANSVTASSRFTAVHPLSLGSAEYVAALNANSGHSLTQLHVDALTAGLISGTETRGTVLRKVAENQAFSDREYNSVFVLMEYFGYLRRDPDAEGFDFWLGRVNASPLRDVRIQHSMACSFITATEYQRRFSSVITHTNDECGP